MYTALRLLILVLLSVSTWSAQSAETVSFNFAGCTDAMKRPVTSKADPALPQLVDVILEEGNRVIVYNPSLMPQLLPETRAFFYAHACAITRLGLPIDRERSAEQVKRADCWAFDTLKRSGLFKDASTLEAVSTDLELSPEAWPLVPGPVRALDAARCSPQATKNNATPSPNSGSRPLKLDGPNASPQWNKCIQACGSRLFSCGRSASCQSSFDQCRSGCKE